MTQAITQAAIEAVNGSHRDGDLSQNYKTSTSNATNKWSSTKVANSSLKNSRYTSMTL